MIEFHLMSCGQRKLPKAIGKNIYFLLPAVAFSSLSNILPFYI